MVLRLPLEGAEVITMRSQISAEHPRVAAALPFVEQLARRVAATMPHSIDIGDLVQDGVIGLIDAAHRFDEARGIKFETFAERRIRGAMIDALRKDAWPRGVRRQRRELEAAREELRRELGCEPSLADLAAKVGSDEKRLGRTIVRINAIESTSPMANADKLDESTLPVALMPSEPEQPDTMFERQQTKDRVRAAIASLPAREQKVISLYYYAEATMKQIGAEIGVNESRVSQLHARAIRRLRDALGSSVPQAEAAMAVRSAILEFNQKHKTLKAAPESRAFAARGQAAGGAKRGVVVDIAAAAADAPGYASVSRIARSRSASRNGLESQRQPVSSRNRSASVPATSPVTKMTRRANVGVAAAIAR
jgi:RNA polymerase sigma factor for flagellar operon FliA